MRSIRQRSPPTSVQARVRSHSQTSTKPARNGKTSLFERRRRARTIKAFGIKSSSSPSLTEWIYAAYTNLQETPIWRPVHRSPDFYRLFGVDMHISTSTLSWRRPYSLQEHSLIVFYLDQQRRNHTKIFSTSHGSLSFPDASRLILAANSRSMSGNR